MTPPTSPIESILDQGVNIALVFCVVVALATAIIHAVLRCKEGDWRKP